MNVTSLRFEISLHVTLKIQWWSSPRENTFGPRYRTLVLIVKVWAASVIQVVDQMLPAHGIKLPSGLSIVDGRITLLGAWTVDIGSIMPVSQPQTTSPCMQHCTLEYWPLDSNRRPTRVSRYPLFALGIEESHDASSSTNGYKTKDLDPWSQSRCLRSRCLRW